MHPLKVLKGGERLASVFWRNCMLGVLLAVGLPMLLGESLGGHGIPIWCFNAVAALNVAYLLWAHISLWNCALNSEHLGYAFAARIYVYRSLLADCRSCVVVSMTARRRRLDRERRRRKRRHWQSRR